MTIYRSRGLERRGKGVGYGNGSEGDWWGYMRFRCRYLRREYSARVSEGEGLWSPSDGNRHGRTVTDVLAHPDGVLYLLRVRQVPVLCEGVAVAAQQQDYAHRREKRTLKQAAQFLVKVISARRESTRPLA